MSEEDLLLAINPFHLELMRPLVKWKILSIKELYEDSNYTGTYKGFQKVVSRLEKSGVLKGNKDVWTKTKRMHLTRIGNELVNHSRWMSHVINDSSFFHDSRVTLYLRYLSEQINITHIELEQELMKIKNFEDLQRIRPDAEFTIEDNNKKKCLMLLEVELTQKSHNRLIEKLNYYNKIPDYKYVLFVFPTESLFKLYSKAFERESFLKGKANYIFALEPGLVKGDFSLEKAKAFFRGETVSLQNVLFEIAGSSIGERTESVQSMWRRALPELF